MAQADDFVENVLLAAMPVAGGFEGAPQERSTEIANLLS